jgi:hypothetical protein
MSTRIARSNDKQKLTGERLRYKYIALTLLIGACGQQLRFEPSHVSRALIRVYGSVTGTPNINVERRNVRLCLKNVLTSELR